MARDEPPRLGVERYREIQNAHWSTEVQVHPKTLGKILLVWDFDVSTEGLFTVVTKGRDQSFSCIVIGGKVGAGPSSLYTIKSDQGL
jgi:hypothetical protein